MLRVAGIRTGVEILGSESHTVVPIDPTYSGNLPSNFVSFGTAGFVNPDLWAHEILPPTGDTPIGYLVLCNPSTTRFDAVSAAFAPSGLEIDGVYKRFRPGEEHWIWLSGTTPWPADFRLRGVEYPAVLTAAVLGLNRHPYRMAVFDPEGANPPPPSAPDHRWEVVHGAGGGTTVGFLTMKGPVQHWVARRSHLHQALIPPSPDGTWTFRKSTAAASADFVPLATPQSSLEPVPDFSQRPIL